MKIILSLIAIPMLLFSQDSYWQIQNGVLKPKQAAQKLQHVKSWFTKTYVSPSLGKYVHQGYATDGRRHYLINTDKIYKYDANWNCIDSNTTPFAGDALLDHMGDGAYANGKLYIPAERFYSGPVSRQTILVFDTTSGLPLSSTNDVSASVPAGEELGAMEVAGNTIWTASYTNGTLFRKFSRKSFGYIGSFTLLQNIPLVQGIAQKAGVMYVSSNYGMLFAVDTSNGYTEHIYTEQFGGLGFASHEGLDYSQSTLRWLLDNTYPDQKIYYLTPTVKNGISISKFGNVAIGGDTADAAFTIFTPGAPTGQRINGLILDGGRPTSPSFGTGVGLAWQNRGSVDSSKNIIAVIYGIEDGSSGGAVAIATKNRNGFSSNLTDYIIDRLTVKGDYRVIIGNPSDSTTTGTLQIKGSSSKKNLLEGRSSSSSTNKIEIDSSGHVWVPNLHTDSTGLTRGQMYIKTSDGTIRWKY